jgi:hypothetical protein
VTLENTCWQDITWFAPIQSNFISNLAFPSGTVYLFARVSDSFGAMSPVYEASVSVSSSTRRLYESEYWEAAFNEVTEALMLKKAQEVNKLSSAIAIEALQQMKDSRIAVSDLRQILSQVAVAVYESVQASVISSNLACEVAGVLAFTTMPSSSLNVSTIDASTLGLIADIAQIMLKAGSVSSLTRECALKFYSTFSNVLHAQTLLKLDNAVDEQVSGTIITKIEACSFQVGSLLSTSLLAGESQQVVTQTMVAKIGRHLASNLVEEEISISDTVMTVSVPSLAGKLDSVSTDTLMSTIISLTTIVPLIDRVTPLSLGISISVCTVDAKLPLEIKSLPSTEAITFSLPLERPPIPGPEGSSTRCWCPCFLLF